MFDSAVLNVVIGLVFIYLLYSLLVTTINEAIASAFNLRAKKLEKAIKRMLDDGIDNHYNIWIIAKSYLQGKIKALKDLLKYLYWKKPETVKNPNSLAEAFYNHEGIKYLGEDKISDKPSYISPEFFSKALLDIIKRKADTPDAETIEQVKKGIEAMPGTETKKFINSLLSDANNDIEKFRELLEGWFNETMQRTSGWYKTQSQKITFYLGFIIAVSFNVNTLSIVQNLSENPDTASKFADVAATYTEAHKDRTGVLDSIEKQTVKKLLDSAQNQINTDISNANSIIGLGWQIPTKAVYIAKRISDTSALKFNKKLIPDDKTISIKIIEIKSDSLIKSGGKFKYPVKISSPNKDPEYFICKKETIQLSDYEKFKYVITKAFSSYRNIIGYLLTALAISFGAPFWFDLLNKFIQIRGSGKKPKETPGSTKNNNNDQPAIKRVG